MRVTTEAVTVEEIGQCALSNPRIIQHSRRKNSKSRDYWNFVRHREQWVVGQDIRKRRLAG